MNRERFETILLLGVSLLVSYVGNDRCGLWDRDEPRYAGTAARMLATGDYVVPYFNDEFRFQKPPLTYWLIAATYGALGESTFAARLFSGLFVAASTLLVARLGDRMFGRPAGLLAGLMLALSPTIVFLGKLAIPDAPQFFFATLAFVALYEVITAAESSVAATATSRWAFLFWIGIGGSILAKGPIAPAMIALTLALYLLVARRPPWRLPLRWRMGLLVVAAIVGPWLGAIIWTTGDTFFRESVGKQLFERAIRPFDKKFLPPGYYYATATVGMAPWAIVAYLAAIRWRSDWFKAGPVAFLMAWFLGSMIPLELFKTKQAHYLAPGYPALALLAAGYVARLSRGEETWRADRWASAAVILSAVSGVVVVGAQAGFAFIGPSGVLAPGLVASVLFAVAIATLTIGLSRGAVHRRMAVTFASLFGGWLVVGGWEMPAMESAKIMPSVAAALAEVQRTRPGPVFNIPDAEPSLMLHSGVAVENIVYLEKYWQRVRYCDRTAYAILNDRTLGWVKEGETPERYVVEQSWRGWVKMHDDVMHLVRIEPLRRSGVESDSDSTEPARTRLAGESPARR